MSKKKEIEKTRKTQTKRNLYTLINNYNKRPRNLDKQSV